MINSNRTNDARSIVTAIAVALLRDVELYFFDEPTLLQRTEFPRSGSVDETWTAWTCGSGT